MISHHAQVKVIGINGQVSLGKEFAGKMVVVEQVEKGTWIIKCGEFIPDSEKWLHQSEGKFGKITEFFFDCLPPLL